MAKFNPVDSCLTCKYFKQEKCIDGKAWCTKTNEDIELKKSISGVHPLCKNWTACLSRSKK